MRSTFGWVPGRERLVRSAQPYSDAPGHRQPLCTAPAATGSPAREVRGRMLRSASRSVVQRLGSGRLPASRVEQRRGMSGGNERRDCASSRDAEHQRRWPWRLSQMIGSYRGDQRGQRRAGCSVPSPCLVAFVSFASTVLLALRSFIARRAACKRMSARPRMPRRGSTVSTATAPRKRGHDPCGLRTHAEQGRLGLLHPPSPGDDDGVHRVNW
jgi:hypothetical protein